MGNSSKKVKCQQGTGQREKGEPTRVFLKIRLRDIVLSHSMKLKLSIGDLVAFPHGLSNYKLWDSHIILARYCLIQQQLFVNRSVIELNGSVGIASIVLKKWVKCASVAICESYDELVINIKKNFERNDVDPNVNGMSVFTLRWAQYQKHNLTYDIIISSDILILGIPNQLLLALLNKYLKQNGLAIFVMPQERQQFILQLKKTVVDQYNFFDIQVEKIKGNQYDSSPLLHKSEGEEEFPRIGKSIFVVVKLWKRKVEQKAAQPVKVKTSPLKPEPQSQLSKQLTPEEKDHNKPQKSAEQSVTKHQPEAIQREIVSNKPQQSTPKKQAQIQKEEVIPAVQQQPEKEIEGKSQQFVWGQEKPQLQEQIISKQPSLPTNGTKDQPKQMVDPVISKNNQEHQNQPQQASEVVVYKIEQSEQVNKLEGVCDNKEIIVTIVTAQEYKQDSNINMNSHDVQQVRIQQLPAQTKQENNQNVVIVSEAVTVQLTVNEKYQQQVPISCEKTVETEILEENKPAQQSVQTEQKKEEMVEEPRNQLQKQEKKASETIQEQPKEQVPQEDPNQSKKSALQQPEAIEIHSQTQQIECRQQQSKDIENPDQKQQPKQQEPTESNKLQQEPVNVQPDDAKQQQLDNNQSGDDCSIIRPECKSP